MYLCSDAIFSLFEKYSTLSWPHCELNYCISLPPLYLPYPSFASFLLETTTIYHFQHHSQPFMMVKHQPKWPGMLSYIQIFHQSEIGPISLSQDALCVLCTTLQDSKAI
jgi:hypothetical protein